MAQYLPPAGPRAIVDFVDVDSAKFEAWGEGGGALAPLHRREARLLAAFEARAAARAAAALFVSDAEADLFRRRGGAGRIVAVENGVDAARYDPAAVRGTAAAQIVFTGQMDYPPNVDAVVWFAGEALPLIRRSHPSARFAIVGRAPTRTVRRLAGAGVIVTGAVPDTRPWLRGASVAVAPLRLARGVQNKVLEAMAMARPVVATSAAAEGIDHGGTVTIADDPAATAAAVVALLNDPAGAAARGAAARARVLARYDWDACLRPLEGLLGL